MNTILIIAAVFLAVLFLLNIRPFSVVLCRLFCGFVLLFILNYSAAFLGLPSVGINIFSATIAGLLELPGCLLLLFITAL